MTETLGLMTVLPELVMAIMIVVLLMVGVFRNGDSTRSTTWLAILTFFVVGIIAVGSTDGVKLAMNGIFVTDAFSTFAKVLILVASGFTAIMSLQYLEREKLGKFEYPVLVMFATLGMMIMVSANDFMTLYLGLELQSLTLYVMAAYHRDSSRATEAGLKYYVLGSLASGMMLYGASLVYGFSGTTSFEGIAKVFASGETTPHLGFITGLVFVIAGLAFKVSAAPFHMWTPDVYEGAPTPVTSFFAVAPKIAAMALFVRVLMGPFAELADQWQQILVFAAVASMIVGAFAAIPQTNIKRLFAYSSIGHVGFMLVGLASGSLAGVQGVLIYLSIYLAMNLGVFAIILSMRQKGRMVERVEDLAGLSKTHPGMAMVMVILMFSMAGVPPLAGFWGKFYVFKAAVDAGLITLAVIGVVTSVVSAYYYLRIIKIMYFDEVVEPIDQNVGKTMGFVMAISAVLIVVFTVVPGPLFDQAKAAAAALMPALG